MPQPIYGVVGGLGYPANQRPGSSKEKAADRNLGGLRYRY